MRKDGVPVGVTGATGALSAAIAAVPRARGAHLAPACRNKMCCARTTEAPGHAPTVLFGADAPDLHAHAAHMAVDEVGGRDAVLTAPGSLALGKSNAVKGNITLQWIKVDTPGARLSVARCEIRPTDIHVLDILLGHPDTERDIADPLPGSPPPDHLNAARAATGALATDAEKLRTGPETTPPLARRGR